MKFPACLILLTSIALAAPEEKPPSGKVLSEKAIVKVSSTSEYDAPERHLNLVRGETLEMAFHTKSEKNPWVILKLPAAAEVRTVEVLNRAGQNASRAATLALSISDDGKTWNQVWSAEGKAQGKWVISLTDAGGKGKRTGWLKLELRPADKEFFHLSRVTVFGA